MIKKMLIIAMLAGSSHIAEGDERISMPAPDKDPILEIYRDRIALAQVRLKRAKAQLVYDEEVLTRLNDNSGAIAGARILEAKQKVVMDRLDIEFWQVIVQQAGWVFEYVPQERAEGRSPEVILDLPD